jgi:hypothetical protein
MKITYLFILISSFSLNTLAQGDSKEFKLTNTIVVAQQDKPEDRYSLEINVLQLLASRGINTKASLNIVKQGGSPLILSEDSIQKQVLNEGFDTYMLISVRGYDKKFKPSTNVLPLEDELNAGHLFPLYREEVTSVTFSVTFYRNNVPVHYELIKTGNVGSRDSVLKKFIKKLDKKLQKSWL